MVDLHRRGHHRRVVDLQLVAGDGVHDVGHRRRGGDEVEVELALEPLPHDLHVQQAEEPAAEPEAERTRRLRLVGEAGVVEAQLLERLAQIGELVAVDRVEAAEHHGLGVLVAGERLGSRSRLIGDRLTRTGLGDVLDAGDEVAGLAGSEAGDRRRIGPPHPDLVRIVDGARLHEPQPPAGLQDAVHDPDRRDHAAVGVVVRVEDQRLQRRVAVAGRRRDPLDHGVEQLRHALAGLGADAQDLVGRDAEHLLDLRGVAVGLGGRAGRSC